MPGSGCGQQGRGAQSVRTVRPLCPARCLSYADPDGVAPPEAWTAAPPASVAQARKPPAPGA